MQENYKYTKDWFYGTELKSKLNLILDKTTQLHILEIGCFEGLGSVYFADHFLNHQDSTLTLVDPFLSIENNDHAELLGNNQEANFDYNTSKCKNQNKIEIYKKTSDDFFDFNNKMFNFIYIDGCHEPEFIIRDMENSFKFLVKGGIMWMDDYRGGNGWDLKKVMDSVLQNYENQYEIIHEGYQLGIRKLQ